MTALLIIMGITLVVIVTSLAAAFFPIFDNNTKYQQVLVTPTLVPAGTNRNNSIQVQSLTISQPFWDRRKKTRQRNGCRFCKAPMFILSMIVITLAMLLHPASAVDVDVTTTSHPSVYSSSTTTATTTSASPLTPFLVVCTVDGNILVLDAYTGKLCAGFSSGRPLVGASSNLNRNNNNDDDDDDDSDDDDDDDDNYSNNSEERRIVPGLDGRLYLDDAATGMLQPLKITVVDVLQNPVKTCSSDQQECGIVTATKAASLFALDAATGRLVWHQQANGKTINVEESSESESSESSSVSSPGTVLLQREDVLVRQLSTDSGEQVWNVTLGTLQALEFGDAQYPRGGEEEEDGSLLDYDGMPGGSAALTQHQHRHSRKHSQQQSSSSTGTTTTDPFLPSLMFGHDGMSLTAVDPRNTQHSLWSRDFPTVVASVFGLSGTSWKPLDVLEPLYDGSTDDNNHDEETGRRGRQTTTTGGSKSSSLKDWSPRPRLLSDSHSRASSFREWAGRPDQAVAAAAGMSFYRLPSWHQVLKAQWNFARIKEQAFQWFDPAHCSIPGNCRQPLVLRFFEHELDHDQRATDSYSSDGADASKNVLHIHQQYLYPPRLALPSSPPDAHLQRTPEGLFLAWPIVAAIVACVVAGILASFHVYTRKKNYWMRTAKTSDTTDITPSLDSSSDTDEQCQSASRNEVSFDVQHLTNNHNDKASKMQPKAAAAASSNRLRRSRSLPNTVGESNEGDDNPPMLDFLSTSQGRPLAKTAEGALLLAPTPAVKDNAASHSHATSSNQGGVGQIDGIPLLRYSRYESEFEEKVPLGKGGFGTVFRCKNALDGREYAIKKVIIRHDISQPQEFSQRLHRVLREVKILALLDHANIVRYYTAWLELDDGKDKDKGSVSAATSDCYMLLSNATTTNGISTGNGHRHRLSSITSTAMEGRRPSVGLAHLRDRQNPLGSDPLGWNDSFSMDNEPSFTQTGMGPPIALEDYGFTFDRSENNDDLACRNKSGNNDDEGAPSTTENTAEKRDSSYSRGLGLFATHDISSSPSVEQSTTWSPETEDQSQTKKAEESTEETKDAPIPSVLARHTLYIQMQLCSQKNLADFLSNEEARRGPSGGDGVDIPYALSLFLQIAKGVKYVHRQGLLHRDLKPNNCFVDDTGVVKVGDFGLSRESGEQIDSTDIIPQESPGVGGDNTAGVGTRSYASPEQMSGSDYDSSTDVYSLGIMLFELCYPMYTVRNFDFLATQVRFLFLKISFDL
jgi:serine/threonine protein kinase